MLREGRLNMFVNEDIKERIMNFVGHATDNRMRPIELHRKLLQQPGLGLYTIKLACKELVDEGKLVYTYRDPCSYVEIPPHSPTMQRSP